MTGQRDDDARIPPTDDPVIVNCARCGSARFTVMYDPKAQGSHVECADCGEVLFL